MVNSRAEIVVWGHKLQPVGPGHGEHMSSFWSSADGKAWHETRAGIIDFHLDVRDAASGPRGLAAVGYVGDLAAAWWSPDTSEWHPGALLPAAQSERDHVAAVAAGRDGFLAVGFVGRNAAAWFSGDGLGWQRLGDGELGVGRLNDALALESGEFLVVGTDESRRDWDASAWTVSADATEWRPADRNLALAGPLDDALRRVWAYPGGFIALGEEGNTRERVECFEGALAAVARDTARSCIWDSEAAIYRSADGISWERLPDSIPRFGEFAAEPLRLWEFTAVEPWGDGLIAVGTGTDWQIRLWQSADGGSWAPVGPPIPVDGQLGNDGHTHIVTGLVVTAERLIVTGSSELLGENSFVLVGETR